MKVITVKNVPAVALVRLFLPSQKCIHTVQKCVGTMLFALCSTASIAQDVETALPETSMMPASSDTSEPAAPESPDSSANNAPQGDEVMSTSQWLARLSNAVRTTNFELSFVQSRAGSETIPFLWRHGILDDGTQVEQLNLQNGPGREQIRVNDVVSVFEPDVSPYSFRSQFVNGPIPSELLYSPENLKTAYEFVSVGRARIAGRPAQQIRIISRDNTRFSYQLWLDEATGMLLKLNMLDVKGGVLEQIQVTSLNVTPEPNEYFSRINNALLPGPMVLTRKQAQEHQWDVGYLPVGMKEVRHDTRRLALTGQVVEYKMFSDGLVDISVYVQRAQDAVGEDMVLRNDLSTFLTLTDGKAQVTVVGEIPLQTANAIATSLKASEDKND
ncbi:MucB/RseB C-terminal domain-containing protein [Alteromonas sp. A079]|uniref:MucB/RseB C-terminal domain-containing protein n=1 Tax=Alteromonas sp. A079 TaxID=3410268 RepID=UPI003B9F4868